MKRLVLLSIAICLVAGTASAADFGARAGLTLSPDQFHIGAHADLGPVIETVRFVPNVEIGFGDDITLIAINADFIYDFAETPWSIGGELGLNIWKFDFGDLPSVPGFDVDDTSTDFGLSVLGDYRLLLNSGKTLLLEAKVGLIDSADFKVTVGWNF